MSVQQSKPEDQVFTAEIVRPLANGRRADIRFTSGKDQVVSEDFPLFPNGSLDWSSFIGRLEEAGIEAEIVAAVRHHVRTGRLPMHITGCVNPKQLL